MTKGTILFTCFRFGGYHGSVIHICEIAEYLFRQGYCIYVAVATCSEEIKQYAQQKGAAVFYWDELPTDVEYDLVWAYHFPILPCLIRRGLRFRKVIGGSLSSVMPLEKVSLQNCGKFLEAPLLFYDKLALVVANSGLCRESLIRCGVPADKIMVMNNLVPESFCRRQGRALASLRKIAVVSNHIPSELLEAADFLRQQMIQTDLYGEGHIYVPITPELLLQYDVVVTIGKTVQYALALGIPVYNYDRFGGAGYLTPENLDHEEFYIFSGKGTPVKKSGEDICREILSGYLAAYTDRDVLRREAHERYYLPGQVDRILEKARNLPENPLTANDISDDYARLCLKIIYRKSGKRFLMKKIGSYMVDFCLKLLCYGS